MNNSDEPTQNFYKQNPRLTTPDKRERVSSFQVDAIKTHIGDLTDKVFIDIGAGDIVLGDKLDLIGIPRKFFVHDLSEKSIDTGLQRLKDTGSVDMSIFYKSVSDCFDFDLIADNEIDAAFSNSLFSHLSLNLITICLKNLFLKMKPGAKYFTSMIVLPDNIERHVYDWSHLDNPFAKHKSYTDKNPFHYTENTLKRLIESTGFQFIHTHEYDHPFQKLVEFHRCEKQIHDKC